MAGEKRGDLGSVLVIGGNGFLGHHIVNQALSSWTCSAVASVDLRCTRNINAGASYHECDITDAARLTELLKTIKPDVVIHTASPTASSDSTTAHELFRKVNIGGTQAVIEACQNSGVKALVYTSSASVVSDNENDLLNADEDWPVIRGAQQKEYYSETKAAAEELVIKANRQEPSKLLTTSLRPAGIFGEGDVQTLAGFIRAYDNKQTHRVDGEIFFVTNDSPVYFWDFARAVWRAAGSDRGTDGVWEISRGMSLLLGSASELYFGLVGKTPTFTRLRAMVSTMTRYYNISKAKRVLRYEPLWTLQEGIDRGVGWFLEEKKRDEAKKSQ
ncbi:3-beta hydroxysteroid dehydrogenase/isomerase [Trichoderma citrinoviride]|uniref:3-beta hydroxysteroid dehydrogenase/isomerase n=1 Tax=Trichoderma citrinoviride TaxID=58853 RepID=A0A2T4BKS0_9HYPO|nr:3-beta hydroxysteroid dehydrogenase/isomerase [Trichoderma citrinoviride]PTB69869.1 3-beta hydroxysteroid dehydrogenase/isomerase [Trichoderma citrinoviride]